MRARPSSRLLVLSPESHLLLFNFCHKDDALTGKSYWATPGGGLESNESFEQAALRELLEETGIHRHSAGASVASQTFTMMLPNGETVLAEEHYFIIQSDKEEIESSGWSENEKSTIHAHHWWSLEELRHTHEIIFPHDLLIDILSGELTCHVPFNARK